MKMSTIQEIDLAGQDPNTREYVEYVVMRDCSEREARENGVSGIENRYMNFESEPRKGYDMPDRQPGIQFSGKP